MTQIVSSISSLEIYAPSAGSATYAKCDTSGRALTKMVMSADVSAYQVVSATGAQLHAGTAYLTSVNTAPVSAARAGNAANASMANSAYYDGTGRLISALPDSATVSAIASGYASSKADASSLSSYALSADVSGVIDTVSSNSASWSGGGGVTFDSSFTGSGTVESPVGLSGALILTCPKNTAQQVHINTGYAAGIAIKAIRSSTLGPEGLTASAGSITNRTSVEHASWGIRFQSGAYNRTAIIDYPAVTSYSSKSANWDDVYTTVSSNSATWGGGGGASLPITGSAGAETATYDVTSVSFVRNDTAGEPDIRTASMSPDQLQINYTYNNQDYTSMTLSESTLDFEDADGAHIVDAYSIDTWNSAVDTIANNSATWGQGGVDSATVSSIASSYAQSAASGKADSSALSSYALSANVSSVINTVASNSASWETTLPISASNGTESAKYSMWGADIVDRKRTAYIDPQTMRLESAADPSDPASYVTAELKPAYLTFKNSASTATVDISSIQKWNSAVDTVSSNSASWGAGGPVTATASAAAKMFTSTGADASSFTGISSINGSALLARNLLPNAQQAAGNAHFHFMPTQSPWGSTEYTGVLSPLQYATGAALAMKQSDQYGAYYKGNEWFLSDVGTNTAANGVVRAELHRTRGIHLYGSSLNSATGFHLNGSGIDGQSGASAWQYGPTEYNMLTSVNDTVSNNSATWGQGGGIDSATCSAIASSYANDVSAAVSGTVDTVSAQSANWGGSALALSAGPGVKLEKVGNTLVAGLDETLLWSGTTTNITGITLNETYGNFDRVRFYWKPWSDTVAWRVTEIPSFAHIFTLDAGWASNVGTAKALFVYAISSNGTEFAQLQGGFQNITGSTAWTSATTCSVTKIVGVNRTAGV